MKHFLMMDMLRAYYWMDEALQIGLRQRGWDNITRSQSLILSNITVGVRRASTLARNIGVTRQAVSQMLSEMEQKGLVKTGPDPDDRRAQIVSFSEKSAGIREDAMTILTEIEGRIRDRIGKRRFEALREAMEADWGPADFSSSDPEN